MGIYVMRFSYATTLACEKYVIVVVLGIGVFFSAIVDCFNPFYFKS